MTRLVVAPAVLALGCQGGPILTDIAGIAFDEESATASFSVRWEDHLVLDPTVAGPGASKALLHTVGAPVGWDLDPETHLGTWFVTPGTDPRLSIALVLASASGREVEAYTVSVQVDPPLDDTDADTDP